MEKGKTGYGREECFERDVISRELPMKIYIWRHSKLFSSWSMFDEPHVFQDNYLQAEIIVLADSESEALELVKAEDRWNVEELKRIVPRVVPVDEPTVVGKFVRY